MKTATAWPLYLLVLLSILLFTPPTTAAGSNPPIEVNLDNESALASCSAAGCTLRQAINFANSNAGDDTILIQPNVESIILTMGQLYISDSVEIIALYGDREGRTPPTFIDANFASRHMEIAAGVEVLLGNFVLNNGVADKGGSILNHGDLTLNGMFINRNTATTASNFGDGGGIFVASSGTLTLSGNSEVTNNSANFGAGIYNNGGTVYVQRSEVRDNTASGHPQSNGGGIRNWNNGRVEIYRSKIIGNGASELGGGIRNVSGVLKVEESEISSNYAFIGGGIWSSDHAIIRRSLLLSNYTTPFGSGGAIYSEDLLELDNSTVFGNTATGGAGVYNQDGTAILTHSSVYSNGNSGIAAKGGITRFTNTFIGDSTTNCTPDMTVNTQFLYDGINIATDTSCGDGFLWMPSPGVSGLVSVPPNPNDDFTYVPPQVLGLVASSPLIDIGDNFFCSLVDQANRVRPVDGPDLDTIAECDVGAFEYGATYAPPTAVRVAVVGVEREFPFPLVLLLLLVGASFGRIRHVAKRN